MSPYLFYYNTSFASPIAKSIGLCQWMMSALNYVLWGLQTP